GNPTVIKQSMTEIVAVKIAACWQQTICHAVIFDSPRLSIDDIGDYPRNRHRFDLSSIHAHRHDFSHRLFDNSRVARNTAFFGSILVDYVVADALCAVSPWLHDLSRAGG